MAPRKATHPGPAPKRLSRLALVVLLAFAAGPISTAIRDAMPGAAVSNEVCHADGSPCPDAHDKSHPCGPRCPCNCCPGHGVALAFVVPPFSPPIPPTDEVKVQRHDDLHPQDVWHRIFRPPCA